MYLADYITWLCAEFSHHGKKLTTLELEVKNCEKYNVQCMSKCNCFMAGF